jgi:hypothetical protein
MTISSCFLRNLGRDSKVSSQLHENSLESPSLDYLIKGSVIDIKRVSSCKRISS